MCLTDLKRNNKHKTHHPFCRKILDQRNNFGGRTSSNDDDSFQSTVTSEKLVTGESSSTLAWAEMIVARRKIKAVTNYTNKQKQNRLQLIVKFGSCDWQEGSKLLERNSLFSSLFVGMLPNIGHLLPPPPPLTTTAKAKTKTTKQQSSVAHLHLCTFFTLLSLQLLSSVFFLANYCSAFTLKMGALSKFASLSLIAIFWEKIRQWTHANIKSVTAECSNFSSHSFVYLPFPPLNLLILLENFCF